jgi:DNA-binding XRE family transcriptional regulator
MPLPAERALCKLGRDLALARRKRGISTSDMAARLFVSRDTLWRLERGEPKECRRSQTMINGRCFHQTKTVFSNGRYSQ